MKEAIVDQMHLYPTDKFRMQCPECGPNRKKSGEKTLSVKIDDPYAVYFCHHCEESGSVNIDQEEIEANEEAEPATELVEITAIKDESGGDENPVGDSFLNEDQLSWLREQRGISEETARNCGLIAGDVWIRSRGKKATCIGFKYSNEDGTTAVKWRDGLKNFTQTGAAKSLWNIDSFDGGDLIICEGEMDALSFCEVGLFATSVPNGAPAKIAKESGSSKKFSYLWDAKEKIDSASRIIIAADNDEPGQILAEEIARRVGKAKCWRIKYPDGCKDANDVLKKCGKDSLSSCLSEATPWPIGGLRDAKEYKDEAMSLFAGGMSRGVEIAIGSLPEIYKPSPQTITICTGTPGSGKSTFLTWLSLKLAEQYDWSCAVFSAETTSQVHLLQLAALKTGKPFMGPRKMSESELSSAIDWLSEKFVFLDEADTSIDSLIERAQAAVLRNGVRLLMIDPYNFITSDSMDDGVKGINTMLVGLKTFAVEHDINVWLVAHPTKMYRSQDGSIPVPGGYDISGSASFFNVADNGLTVSKVREGVCRITSWKSRFSWIGSTGEVDLVFDPEVGNFQALREWRDDDDEREDWYLK